MILVLQFRQDITEQHEQQCIRMRLNTTEQITFLSIFDTNNNFADPAALLHGANKLILGGSAGLSMAPGHSKNDYEKIEYIKTTVAPLITYVLGQDFPTLGTCFGHQLIAHFAGGTVAYDDNQAETGTYDVTLTKAGAADPFFAGVPTIFSAIEGHQDSVVTLPKTATVLATSERNQFQALRYGNNVYSTQFHCELNEKDMMYRISLFPVYAAHASQQSMAVAPSPYGVVALTNFLHATPL